MATKRENVKLIEQFGKAMQKLTKSNLLLFSIFAFAFIYRITLLLLQTYPPGSDIGFHASAINSFTQMGKTDFLWNSFQMGGEVELEFPGYHIFAIAIMFMTGLPNYLAQALAVALFSSFIVLAIFLVTRIMWNESAAFIAAFFIAISRTDIEILCWGGYPNIIALFLIPTIFYLFLKSGKISKSTFSVSASLLVSSIMLVHSLSAAVFLGTTAAALLILLVFPKTFRESRKNIFLLALPVVVGGFIVSPYLANAVQIYLNENVTLTGVHAIEQTLFLSRAVSPLMSLAIFVCIVPLFLLSKTCKGRFFSVPIFLLAMWLLVPLLLTQDYQFGLYLDSIRFLYFLVYPVLIILALTIDYLSMHIANTLGGAHYNSAYQQNLSSSFFCKNYSRIKGRINYKTAYTGLLLVVLLVVSLTIPIFSLPGNGVEIQNFYQVMNKDGYEAIEWAKQNTPPDSVFVSDMSYGWWLAGFGQRRTLSDINFNDITLNREVNISRVASYLLDTAYLIDNGYIQVREDGGYIGRHNPQFLADLNWTTSPFGFFQFNNSEITLTSQNSNNRRTTNLMELPVVNMQLVGANTDSPSMIVNKENNDFNYSEIITITKGKLLANLTITVQSNNTAVSFENLNIVIYSQGIFQPPFNNTLLFVDPAAKECGQLVFEKAQPQIDNSNNQTPCITKLKYDLEAKSKAEIQILVGIYPLTESEVQNLQSPTSSKDVISVYLQNLYAPDLPIFTFDYKSALHEYNISYVANRDFELYQKFANDPEFRLVFINNEVAIFKVETNDSTVKG